MEIKIDHLTQYYGKKQVLKDINLTIEQGMFGLLGRNGAGKTTLMKVLATLLPKRSGEISMAGVSIEESKKIRHLIGYLPQDFSMYGNMSAYEALDYLGVLSGLTKATRKVRIPKLLAQVNLSQDEKTKVKAMSGGMKRRLGIAQAILHEPKILMVDEPTAGLDPEERVRFRNLLAEIAGEKIVILSTHIAGDIEATAEKLAVMDQGQLIYNGTVSELLKQATGHIYRIRVPRVELPTLKEKVRIINLLQEGIEVEARFIVNSDHPLTAHPLCQRVRPTMEDAYMYLMEQKAGAESC